MGIYLKEQSESHELSISAKPAHAIGRWHSASDQDIWKAFKAGNKSSLIHIYNLYFNELFVYALQFDPDRENVKDNIQDLFVYLYKHRKSLGHTDNIKFYLFKSLRRRIKISGDKRKLLTPYDSQPDKPEKSFEDELIAEEHQINSKKMLNQAIQHLPAKQKEIIYYYFYQNFSYRQIAEIMHFSQVKSARKLLYRALQSLREQVNLKTLFGFILILLLCM